MKVNVRNAIRGALVLLASAWFIQAPNAEALSLREYRARLGRELVGIYRASQCGRRDIHSARRELALGERNPELRERARVRLENSLLAAEAGYGRAKVLEQSAIVRLGRFKARLRAKLIDTAIYESRRRFFTRLNRVNTALMAIERPAQSLARCVGRYKIYVRRLTRAA